MNWELLSIDERLPKYELALNVALTDEDIKPILANYGYDEATITEGKQLYDTAVDLQHKQKREYGDKYGASNEFKQARKNAYKQYMEFVELARIALKRDPNLMSQLDINGRRESVYEKSVTQMERFYTNALASDDIKGKLARFNITEERLNAGKALVDTMKAKRQEQQEEASEAQRATRDRDAAIDVLDDWMDDFLAVSEIALRSQPEYLERMGIIYPSS
jgi:hypothetical protein